MASLEDALQAVVVVYANRGREEGFRRDALARELQCRGHGRFAQRAIDVAITLGWLEIRQQPPAEPDPFAVRTSSDEDFLVGTCRMFADLATGEEAGS